MLTTLRPQSKFQSPPARRDSKPGPVESKPETSHSVDLFQANCSPSKPGLGRLLASASALALSVGSQTAQAAETVLEQQALAEAQEIDLVLSSTRAADTVVDPLLGKKWTTPDTLMGKDGGKKFHFAEGAMERVTAKHVTSEKLPPGAPRLTARGVDPNQSSKRYPEGQLGWRLTEPFKECTSMAGDGTCLETEWNAITYQNLSCLYTNESTGEVVRVLHRSTANNNTSQMDRSVCAGHRLVKDSQGFYGPVQTDESGKTLYVNPLVIVSMETVQ